MSYTASYIVNSNSAQGATDFTFSFPYIEESHIEVYLNYSKINQGTAPTEYQVISTSPTKIRLNQGLASANLRVEIRRNSSLETPLVDYADGSTLTSKDLDTSALQSLYIDQELKDNQGKTVSVDETTGLPTLNNLRLTKVADPTAAQDAATKNYVDTKQFTSAQIQDGTLVNTDINSSAAIAGTKINPDFGNQNITTTGNIVVGGTVDGRDIAALGTKLDGIDAGAKDDQTAAEIRTLVANATDSNVYTDAEKLKLAGCDTGATDDQTAAEIRALVESATNSNVFTDADHTKVNAAATLTGAETLTNKTLTSPVINDMSGTALVTSGTSTSDNKTYSAKRAGEIFYGKDTVGEIQSGEAWSASDDKIATTSAIDARIIDLVEEVGGFVPIANETSFPTTNPDINNGVGTLVSVKEFASSHTPSGGTVTIANGAGSGNTVTITGCGSTVLAAGFGGILETTSTLHTYTFHRLAPKATQVTTVATNITNINTVATNNTNINTVATNNSNITTVATNISNINSVHGSIANVNTVATNLTDVSNFADLYQIATSAPSTDGGGNSLAAGDLWFDSSSNKVLKVHDGSAFKNVTPTQSVLDDISIVSGTLTRQEDLGSITDSITSGSSTGALDTCATNITNINSFANVYRIAASAPSSSLDEGDLWYDSTANVLKYYNGTVWTVTAAAGLSNIVEDTSPELGGHLDCNNKNLTEVGTISGNNLQVDFGTLT